MELCRSLLVHPASVESRDFDQTKIKSLNQESDR
jgi:hypothetical protein